ncbi:MAG: 30S ribosome-binding factor RbfA [Gemmatimonadales bacterium]|jgi:ribosome-binding factor A
MKGSSRRPEQIAENIRQVVADALTRDIRDPRIGLVTLTHVTVSADLSHAKIRVSTQGDEETKQRALEGLRSASGFLRTRVAKALTTRTVPELHFELDRGLEHAARINEVLESLKQEEQD